MLINVTVEAFYMYFIPNMLLLLIVNGSRWKFLHTHDHHFRMEYMSHFLKGTISGKFIELFIYLFIFDS